MGQKVNPIGLRLGINKTWASRWYASPREYADLLHEDLKIRAMLQTMPECKNADVADIEIIRHPQRVTIVIHKKVQIKIKEVKRAELNASLVAQNVARQLMGRASFRKALKQGCFSTMKAGAQGIKIRVSGRLGGAEMSRTEEMKEGRIPLHTLRADIDYGFAEAHTTYGKIGVKVWLYSGMMYGSDQKDDAGLLLKKQRKERAPRSEKGRGERAEAGRD